MFRTNSFKKDFEQNQRAMKAAQAKIPFSSNNPPYQKKILSDAETDVIQYKRNVSNKITLSLGKSIDNANPHKNLCMIILQAIGAEASQCGNCGELASATFCEFLETNIEFPIELVIANFLSDEGTSDGHSCVLKNRSEEFEFLNLDKWANTTLLDPWGRNYPLNFINSKTPTVDQIVLHNYGKIESVSIETYCRRSENLNYDECLAILKVLQDAKNALNETAIKKGNIPSVLKKQRKFFRKKGLDQEIVDAIVVNYKKIVDEKIKLYTMKAKQIEKKKNANNKNNKKGIISAKNTAPKETATAQDLINELSTYLRKRTECFNRNKKQYNSLWNRLFTDITYDVKSSAVTKMLRLLIDQKPDDFTDLELEALRKGTLGTIVSKENYADLLPAEFLSQEQAKALKHFRLFS